MASRVSLTGQRDYSMTEYINYEHKCFIRSGSHCVLVVVVVVVLFLLFVLFLDFF